MTSFGSIGNGGNQTLLVVIAFLTFLVSTTLSKEIELTKEWQVVGTNDTVPEGAHIRMDLSTGEKWVKMLEEEEEGDRDAATDTRDVQIQSDGTAAVVVTKEDSIHSPKAQAGTTAAAAETQAASKGGERNFEVEPDYDYDMMHRTLSQLPKDEQERMGLPDIPGGGRTTTAEERKLFEMKMKQIWEKRQEDLQRVQEDSMVDLPEILKERIRRIREYIQDPHKGLVEMTETPKVHDEEGASTEGDFLITDMESVLVDLEYQLTDLDMTRDFHTLGGWPLLASLLADETHETSNHTLTAQLVQARNTLQTNAAWALGTAVKNTAEFFPYAIEEVSIGGGKTTTPLALLLEQYVSSDEDTKKRQKMLYGMGGFLRGNRLAQLRFVELDGPAKLFASGQEVKLTKKLLALVGDLVSDVLLLEDELAQSAEEDVVVQALSSPAVCVSLSEALSVPQLEEVTIRTMEHMAQFCDFDTKEIEEIERIKEDWGVRGMDSELLSELVSAASAAIMGIQKKK